MDLIYKTEEPYFFKTTSSSQETSIKKRKGWSIVTPKTFSERITFLRSRLNLTQKEMVKTLNRRCRPHIEINLRKYQRWEQGRSLKRFLSVSNLYILSKAFHVPLTFLTETNARIPELWKAGNLINKPPKELKEGKDSKKENLNLYQVKARYRADTHIHFVYAGTKRKARQMFREEIPAAEINEVKSVQEKSGVVV